MCLRHGAATLIGLALIAGCSSDSGSSPTTAPATTAPATTEPAPESTSAETSTSVDAANAGLVFGFLRPPAGVLYDLSVGQERALQFAVDDINAAGGVNGRPATIVTADEPLGGAAIDGLDALITKGANVILGPIGSSSALAVVPQLESRQMILCSGSASVPQLATLDTVSAFYRTVLSDQWTVTLAADKLTALRDQAPPPEGTQFKVGILARSDDYGTSVGNGLASELVARDFAANVVGYNPRKVVFTEEAATIAAQQNDLVVVVSYGEAPNTVKALIQAGIPANQIAGLDAMLNPRLGEQAFPGEPGRIDGLHVFAPTGDRSFIDRMVADASDKPILYGPQLYDCAITVAIAAAAANSNAPTGYGPQMVAVTNGSRSCSTYDDCVTKLKAGETVNYQGAVGNIAFDANGDPSQARFTTAAFSDGGQLKEVSSQDIDLATLSQQQAMASVVFMTRLQQGLKLLGYYDGPIDGLASPAVTEAITQLQTDLGLPPTGVYDAETDAALRAKLGGNAAALEESTKQLQQSLTTLGFYSGPIDGKYSAEVVAAVQAFQAVLGVPQTGIIDTATLKAAYEKGIASSTAAHDDSPHLGAAADDPSDDGSTSAANDGSARDDDDGAARRHAVDWAGTRG